MQKIVLLMQRMAIVSSLENKLNENLELNIIHKANYELVKKNIIDNVKVYLIEVAESGPFDIYYCLDLVKFIKKLDSNCKLLLMCSEHDEMSIDLVLKAKRDSFIDDFVFYDVTIDYLASKLLAL